MITINEKRRSLCEDYMGLYRSSLNVHSEYFSQLESYMKQYLGSYELDNAKEPATTVRNITYEMIESQIDPDIPFPKAEAEIFSEKGERCERSIERLCRSVRQKLPFEQLNDLDERYTYIYGGSVWYVEWDNSDCGGVKIHCLSPLDFIPEPGVCRIEDMRYCFLRFITTRSELTRRYGASPDEVSLADCEYRYSEAISDEDTVTVVICLYRDSDGDICKLVFSGNLILADIPKCFIRRVPTKSTDELLETPTELIEGSLIEGEDEGLLAVPYYVPKDFPIVVRQNIRISPSLFGLSDCERVRPQQQAINKVESRILKKLLRAGITPIIPEDAAITLGNSIFGEIIRMRPGESLDNYGKLDTTPDIEQDIMEADRLYDHAKRVLGISDALQGLDNTQVESGFARQLKINRASSRLETKKRMKYLAYANIYRLIFEQYLAFSDEPKLLDFKDTFGNIRKAAFNRYDFIERDTTGRLGYLDSFVFSVDLNGGSEYSRELLWQRNLSNLESGTLGDKSSPLTLLRYWQLQESAHYPFAKENVEHFRALAREIEEENTQKNQQNVNESEQNHENKQQKQQFQHGLHTHQSTKRHT